MNYGAMGQLLGSRVTPSEGNLMKKSSGDIPENGLKKVITFFPIEGNLMKKRPGDIPENDFKETVLILESEVDPSKMSPREIKEKILNDALTYLNKVSAGKITERNYKPPPKSIECMIAEQVHREAMHLDHGAVGKLYKKIKSVDDAIKYFTDTCTRLLDERAQNEKGELREIVKIKRSDINSKIVFVDDKIDRHNKYRKKLVEMHDEAKQYYYREFNAAAQRAIKTVDETMPWEMRVVEMKPGRQVRPSNFGYTMRDIGIINGYKEELAKYPGPSGPGQKKRIIQKMAEKLEAAGKRRSGSEKIRKILARHGIK